MQNYKFVVFVLVMLAVHSDAADLCDTKCKCDKTHHILRCEGITQEEFEGKPFQNTIHAGYEKIHITNGNIKELPRNIFGTCAHNSSLRMDSLKLLDLQHNFIEEIHGQTFHCMPNLEELNLSFNQWNVSAIDIHTGIFTSVKKLKHLFLTNAFHDDVEAPAHLMHLNTIFLENGLDNLSTLKLDANRFSGFGKDSAAAICSFPNLRRLNLANNLLSKITIYHIRCTPHLEYLDLSDNSFITFGEDDYSIGGLFYGMDYIESGSTNLSVNLNGNEFDCDCGLLEFRNWLKRTKVHVVNKTNLTCHEGNLNGRRILSLQSTDFKCFSVNTSSSSNHAVVGVLITMFVLIALFLFVMAYLKREKIKGFVTSFKKPSLAREHLFGYSSVNNENATDLEV